MANNDGKDERGNGMPKYIGGAMINNPWYKHILILRLVAIILLAMVCVFSWMQLTRPPLVRIVTCDVGQGDAILVTFGQRHLLIDAGPNQAVLRCLQANILWWRPIIDVAVMTHPDQDHSGGWPSVLQRYRIHNFVSNGLAADWTKILPPAAQAKIDHWHKAEPGDAWMFPEAMVTVVWSESLRNLFWPTTTTAAAAADTNSASVGLFLAGSGFGFLTQGDLECPQELALSTFGLLSEVSILKVSHHGAKTATCDQFLPQIRPELALISVGKENNYGHPEVKTLSNLEKWGSWVLRTDQLGAITLFLSGQGWRLRTEKPNLLSP
jgi:competence protein ComEC